MRVAIMQPTYLPWIGLLAMIDRVDRYVFLDDVGFDRSSWQQRNYIRNGNDRLMLTVPVVKKGLRGQALRDVEIQPDGDFPEKHIRSITMTYQGAPHFDAFAPELFRVMRENVVKLCDLNVAITRWLLASFGIGTPTMMASEIGAGSSKAGHLVALCRALDATRYLSAPGSRAYLDVAPDFPEAGIPVAYHEYQHPVYEQKSAEFVPYLGAVDLLFNVGGGGQGLAVIRSGIAAEASLS